MDERDLHYLKKETKLNGRYIITSVLGEGGFGITYYGVDGAVNTNPSGYTVETETITLQAPVRAGYTFKGWYTNERIKAGQELLCKMGSQYRYPISGRTL